MTRLQLRNPTNYQVARSWIWMIVLSIFSGVAGLISNVVSAQAQSDPENHPQLVSKGTLFICGGGVLPWKLTDRFIELAGGKDARIVVVTTASYFADRDIKSKLCNWYDRLADNGFASLDILHSRSREEADDPRFSQVIESATAIWFVGGNQNWVAESYLGTKSEERMHSLLLRGGVIGGTSAGAAIMSRCMIADGTTEPFLSTGFGFLSGAIVDQHFVKRKRLDRLKRAMEIRPGLVGVGIDEGTALIVRGRTLEVMGESEVCLRLGPSADRPEKTEWLKSGQIADLVAWRRAAMSRVGLLATTGNSHTPDVRNGTLVIVGGGRTPQEAVDTFLAAAGGKEASIVVVSNALGDARPQQDEVCGWLSAAGATNVQLLHPVAGEDLSNPKLVDLLKQARGVWFTGGRQWRLVDAFLDTPIETLFHEVLSRGGVIGGTSAGATIQGEYLMRGNPLGNKDVSEEGYERGFGFLPGVAIDQHFTQRERLDDMVNLKKTHPELIGLGVDESTALVVRGSTMQVIGQHNVVVFDRGTGSPPETPEFAVLKSGERYDFRQHRRMDRLPVDPHQ